MPHIRTALSLPLPFPQHHRPLPTYSCPFQVWFANMPSSLRDNADVLNTGQTLSREFPQEDRAPRLIIVNRINKEKAFPCPSHGDIEKAAFIFHARAIASSDLIWEAGPMS
jgi:hypothetical protein